MATEKLQPGMLIRYERDPDHYVLVRRLVEREEWIFSMPGEECWEYISPHGPVRSYFFQVSKVRVVKTEPSEDLL